MGDGGWGLVLRLTASFAVLCAFSLPGADLQRFEAVEPHMGTLFRITLYAYDSDAAHDAFSAAFARVNQLDEILSDYNPRSELMRVCRDAGRQPVQTSVELFTVLAASQELAQETDGAFDVTLAPVIRLWRQARKDQKLPARSAIDAALGRCGYLKLVLDGTRRTVFLELPDMLLDLGGIAKGYAADEALQVLRAHGIRRALVAASGDLSIGDPPPGKGGWRVGIDVPEKSNADSERVLTLRNAGVSTSGDAEQFLDAGGTRYSHIIDPKTGIGLTRSITVTIVARRGIDSDGLATAVSVLGVTRGLDLIESRSDAAALIVEDGRVFESKDFQSRLMRICLNSVQ
jgi:thiamine biosynthesis lipoprotein